MGRSILVRTNQVEVQSHTFFELIDFYKSVLKQEGEIDLRYAE